jgi:hypothetical protein
MKTLAWLTNTVNGRALVNLVLAAVARGAEIVVGHWDFL